MNGSPLKTSTAIWVIHQKVLPLNELIMNKGIVRKTALGQHTESSLKIVDRIVDAEVQKRGTKARVEVPFLQKAPLGM